MQLPYADLSLMEFEINILVPTYKVADFGL